MRRGAWLGQPDLCCNTTNGLIQFFSGVRASGLHRLRPTVNSFSVGAGCRPPACRTFIGPRTRPYALCKRAISWQTRSPNFMDIRDPKADAAGTLWGGWAQLYRGDPDSRSPSYPILPIGPTIRCSIRPWGTLRDNGLAFRSRPFLLGPLLIRCILWIAGWLPSIYDTTHFVADGLGKA